MGVVRPLASPRPIDDRFTIAAGRPYRNDDPMRPRLLPISLLAAIVCCCGCMRTKMTGPVTALEIPSAALLASYAMSSPTRIERYDDRSPPKMRTIRSRSDERPDVIVRMPDNFRSSTTTAPDRDTMQSKETERLDTLLSRGGDVAKSICSRC